MTRRVGKWIGLVVVTLFAFVVMYVSGGRNAFNKQQAAVEPEETAEAEALAPVMVLPLEARQIEILDSYAGTIQPLERFTLAFEMAGRIESLGTNAQGQPLDVGDEVSAGQVLATLDRRILAARRDEAAANLENAQIEYERLANLQERSAGAVTEVAFQQATRELAIAKAQLDVAEKTLEDAVLVAPEDGVISARQINAGESINMHQVVFEVVQVDRVLLRVGVPESRIVPMQRQFNATRRSITVAGKRGSSPVSDFVVYLRRFHQSGQQDKDELAKGTVYRIAEVASDRSGLFEVEVLIDNPDRLLKPGLVAKADFVIREIEGYQIPIESVVFSERKANLFFAQVADDAPTETVQFAGMKVAEVPHYVARQVELNGYIEQGRFLVVPQLPQELKLLVVKGQHRLVEGRPLEIMGSEAQAASPGMSPIAKAQPTAEVSRLEQRGDRGVSEN